MEDTNNYYPLQQLGYREDYAITLQGEIVETANKQPIRKGKGERYKTHYRRRKKRIQSN